MTSGRLRLDFEDGTTGGGRGRLQALGREDGILSMERPTVTPADAASVCTARSTYPKARPSGRPRRTTPRRLGPVPRVHREGERLGNPVAAS